MTMGRPTTETVISDLKDVIEGVHGKSTTRVICTQAVFEIERLRVCPLCHHPHLQYTDEPCVSCGCKGPMEEIERLRQVESDLSLANKLLEGLRLKCGLQDQEIERLGAALSELLLPLTTLAAAAEEMLGDE